MSIASLAASVALFSPFAEPDPIIAGPTSFITVLRSAKSALINPGTFIRSVIPLTFFCIIESSLSLGTVIMVSAYFCNSSQPSSALRARYFPSKLNGLVTTATVSAPISLLALATIGAAPVPVPPPRPAVTKTMSLPFNASRISSTDSMAAILPVSGSAPAPRPLVMLGPSWRQTSAFD